MIALSNHFFNRVSVYGSTSKGKVVGSTPTPCQKSKDNFMKQGEKAVHNGREFERLCEKLLEDNGYTFETQVPYTNLYGSNRCKIDIVVDELHIECKFQDGSGSVDEKIPFCLHNLEQFGGGLIILGGRHWESERGKLIRKWANEQPEFNTRVLTYDEVVEDIHQIIQKTS